MPFKSQYEADLERLFCETPSVMRMTLKGRVFTKPEFKVLVKEDFVTSQAEQVGLWCLTSHSEDKVIGVSGIFKCAYLHKADYEFGFILDENNWGKGFATELGNFWFGYAKNEMQLTEILATVSPQNMASRRVLEKLQMEYVAEMTSAERGERLILRKAL